MIAKVIALLLMLFTILATAANPSLEQKKSSRKSQIANFIAGGLAGTISSTLTMPLEVVKTQLQSSRIAGKSGPLQIAQKILQTQGPNGFFKGIKPMLIGIMPTRAIYFWAYSSSKASLTARFGNTPINHLLSAFAAGIASNTIMNPLWMVKTRFQIIADTTVGQRSFKNYQEVARAIWREEGPSGFFKGLTASYVGCFEGAIQWIVYEKLKSILSTLPAAVPLPLVTTNTAEGIANKRKSSNGPDKSTTLDSTRKTRTPSPGEYFLAAALSKGVAVLATYPHEVVRTRLREQATSGVFKYRGFMGALTTIAREEGRRGLYGGMGMHLLRSVPNAAVMFLSFELVSTWLDKQAQDPTSLFGRIGAPKVVDGVKRTPIFPARS